MNPGDIVYRGISDKGNSFILRYPKLEDLPDLWEYINKVSKEQTFILFQGEQLTIDEEKEWLEGQLKKLENKEGVQLVLEINDKVVGTSEITLSKNAEAHVGSLGISIDEEYRHQGIGKKLMEQILDEAKKNLEGLKIVRLSVFANNPVAIKLYEELGFKKMGVLPKGLLHKGAYVDHIYMYKPLV